jgi:hypothetical protein
LLGLIFTAAAAAAHPTVVPLQLRDHAPLLMARIDGVDVALVFDSGDQSTLALQASVLQKIKAVPTGDSSEQHYVKGDPVRTAEYRLTRLEVGAAVFSDFVGRADMHAPSYPANDVGQKGFLGTGLLKSYEVVLDYRHRTLSLIPRAQGEGASAQCQGTSVPFSPEWHGEPVTSTDTDLGPVTLWWDTGAPTSGLTRRFVQQMRPGLQLDKVTSRRFMLGSADFGPWKFPVWDVSPPPGFNGFVGYDFFAGHVVCFDFPGRRVVIRR